VAKKRKAKKKAVAKAAVIRRLSPAKKSYRRKNPSGGKSGLMGILMEAGAAVLGYVASDYAVELLGMKYAPKKQEGLTVVKKSGEKDVWEVTSKRGSETLTTSEAIGKGYLVKGLIPNVLIPGALGALVYSYLGKGKNGNLMKAGALGMMANAGVEAVESFTKATSGKNIVSTLQGLGQGYEAIPSGVDLNYIQQLAMESARAAAAENAVVNGLGNGYFDLTKK